MNCAVCGNPLLANRSAFRCSCGVFVHAYCWDKHVLQAHQPVFEVGTIDLDGEFQANADEAVQAPAMQIAQSAGATEEVVMEAVGQAADETAQAPVEQSVQPAEAAEEVVEGTVEETLEKTAEETVVEAVGQAADETAQAPVEQVTHSPQKQKKKQQKKKQ